MKILHITHLYPRPYDPLLGIAMHEQVKTLEKQGCINKVISPSAWAPFPIKHLSPKWKAYSKVPIHAYLDDIEVYYPRYISFPKALLFASSGNRMYHGIRGLIQKIARDFQFDLIHAHMALPDGYAGMLVSKQYQKPLIITFQATDIDITANRSDECFDTIKKVLSYANNIISPSPRLTRTVKAKFGFEPAVIGYGIYISDIFVGATEIPKRHEGKRLLLSVSRLISTKGIDLNLLAIKKLINKYENLLYLVVGDGPERNALERLVSSLNLNRHVKFIGQVSHSKAMEYMAGCEIFTMPSWQETFGLVYIEAMAHAKPIIGVRGQGVDGIVEHGKTGMLVKPRDVDSLVEALDFLLSHPEEAKAMGERGRKLVLENYTWEKNAERTIAVYEEALRNASR